MNHVITMKKVDKALFRQFEEITRYGGRISKFDVAKALGLDDNEIFLKWQDWEKFKTFTIEGDYIVVDKSSNKLFNHPGGAITNRCQGEEKGVNGVLSHDQSSPDGSHIVREWKFENLGRPGQATNYTDVERPYLAKDRKKAKKAVKE